MGSVGLFFSIISTNKLSFISEYIINKWDMQSNSKQRSPSFLQKFEGRKNAVGKEGLIHLLEQKLQSRGGNTKANVSNRNQNNQKVQPQSLAINKKQLSPLNQLSVPLSEKDIPKGAQSQRYGQRKQGTSSQQLPSRKTQIEHLIQLKSQQLNGNKLKLPSINKTESSSINSHKLQISVNTQIQDSPIRTKSVPRKAGYSESVVLNNFGKILQLDSYALKHLECLDKFEKIVVKQKADNATRSVLSESK